MARGGGSPVLVIGAVGAGWADAAGSGDDAVHAGRLLRWMRGGARGVPGKLVRAIPCPGGEVGWRHEARASGGLVDW